MNKNEPLKQYNFTSTGYEIIPLTIPIRSEIKSFYYSNYHLSYDEKWNSLLKESFLLNYWIKPTKLIPITESFLSEVIILKIQPIVEKWINNSISLIASPTLRIHSKDSIILSHIESLPKVITIIYQIDLNEEDEEEGDIYSKWSLELIDHQGNLHDITLSKGELLIYEVRKSSFSSYSCLIE